MDVPWEPRRAKYLSIDVDVMKWEDKSGIIESMDPLDTVYRTIISLLFNFVPTSGHPGGSTSSGRIVESLMFHTLDYDFNKPLNLGSDFLVYAAGHKALGLYAISALRNEVMRVASPSLLPQDVKKQLRFEDLLGFRRNPTCVSDLFSKFHSKPLDGHPTPATPHVVLATGASGVGIGSSFGLAFGAMDTFGIGKAPLVHVIEGEGGATPGRVHEAIAGAATLQLSNVVLHLDWNQAAIDTEKVCREKGVPGDYVQWNPCELFYLHDWNVIYVPDGFDFKQILAAQQMAKTGFGNNQPTAVIYRTVKGWKYGIEGRRSHGAGHPFCSPEFYSFLTQFETQFGVKFPRHSKESMDSPTWPPEDKIVEQLFWEYLSVVRGVLERDKDLWVRPLANSIEKCRERFTQLSRAPRSDHPRPQVIHDSSIVSPTTVPFVLPPGTVVTTRAVLADVLGHLNRITNGAVMSSAADLLGSTSVLSINKDFSQGFYNSVSNPSSRVFCVGGICEDALTAYCSGLSTFGYHIGATASYGAFLAPLGHVASRLHAIGQQTKVEIEADHHERFRKHASNDHSLCANPIILICAHSGPKTGEDGPTHACPQSLQMLEGNFPPGTMVTLTPWDANEIWFLMVAAFRACPAIIAPFVTRPPEKVIDREALRISPAKDCVTGMYSLRRSSETLKTFVIQGNGVMQAFLSDVLPVLDTKKIPFNLFYVASTELFDFLPKEERSKIYPEELARNAMGISEFTLPTMYRWVTSEEGRGRTLYPHAGGLFLGSGQGFKVFRQAGLDGENQLKSALAYLQS